MPPVLAGAGGGAPEDSRRCFCCCCCWDGWGSVAEPRRALDVGTEVVPRPCTKVWKKDEGNQDRQAVITQSDEVWHLGAKCGIWTQSQWSHKAPERRKPRCSQSGPWTPVGLLQAEGRETIREAIGRGIFQEG